MPYSIMFMASPAALGYIKMIELHDYVQFYLVIILFFVLWFYVNILFDFTDFNKRLAPTYSIKKAYTHIMARGIAHIGWLEVIWTIIPIFILTAIAIPSFKLLYALDVVNSPLLTLRCIGNQWYWTYECDLVKTSGSEMVDFYREKKHVMRINNITWVWPNYCNTPTWESPDWEAFIQPQLPKFPLELLENEQDILTTPYDADQNGRVTRSYKYILTYQFAKARGIILTNYDWSNFTLKEKYLPVEARVKAGSIPAIKDLVLDYDDINENLLLTHVIYYPQIFISEQLVDLILRTQEQAESFAIDSYMLDEDELQLGAFRLLEVDNFPILPADAEIRIAVTGTDVIHSYAVPSLGIKIDAIPGRLNQFGIRVRSPGTYYGQCSELCGVGHGFMPIKIQFIKFIK